VITLANNFSGLLVRFLSSLVLLLSPSLRNQFDCIKKTVAKSRNRKKEIPNQLTTALITIEDRRFYQHKGVDICSIARAIAKNITTKRLEGASTIGQQLIRNITGEREIKLRRKIKEIFFATLLDKQFSKSEILFAYFDTYRFKACIGIFAFCEKENYNLRNLSITETAEISARFKYPTLCTTNYIKYLKRVRTIERKITLKIALTGNGQSVQNKCLINAPIQLETPNNFAFAKQ
jgi:membrane carboxypeptidase/penicillin-binding protein